MALRNTAFRMNQLLIRDAPPVVSHPINLLRDAVERTTETSGITAFILYAHSALLSPLYPFAMTLRGNHPCRITRGSRTIKFLAQSGHHVCERPC